MKIFNTSQIRKADELTITLQGISSAQLMERAGYGLFRALERDMDDIDGVFRIFCGVGNNGGDGLVIARHLVSSGKKVVVYIVNFSSQASEDFIINRKRLSALPIEVIDLAADSSFPEVQSKDVIIDAVFGIGLNRRPPGWVEKLFFEINSCEARVISVDVPSGLYMHKRVDPGSEVVHADHTYTFETPKLVFLLPDTGTFTNSWSLIGIDQVEPKEEVPVGYLATAHEMADVLKVRERFSHKGSYGHVWVAGGSYGKIGAVVMCAEAALTAGAGLVSAVAPSCGYAVLQTTVPEVMCVPVSEEYFLSRIPIEDQAAVVAAGPGMGVREETANALKVFLSRYNGRLVLDADALNILAAHAELWELLPEHCVLTPHPGELKRLIGGWQDDFEKLEKVRHLARERKVILVVKGAYTLVTDGDILWFNSTGNPGMATGGSGDVLTGIIAGLIAQGYTPFEAAQLGVYLHGSSGDIAIRQCSEWALKATDLIDFLGDAFLELQLLKDQNSNRRK